MYIAQQIAANAVRQVLAGKNLTLALPEAQQRFAKATLQQRGAGADLSYGTLRFYGELQYFLRQLLDKPLSDSHVHALLLVALYQLCHDKADDFTVVNQAVKAAGNAKPAWAKGLVNGVLRNFLRQRASLTMQLAQHEDATYSYPQWWIDTLKVQYPQHWQSMLLVGNTHPPMTLRVNQRKISTQEYMQLLERHDIAAQQEGPCAVILQQPMAVDIIPGFADGVVSVQDMGAQLAPYLLDLAPNMRVLDACCAPGGKTGHLLESADIDLTAIDNDAARLSRVTSNLTRLSLQANLKVGSAAILADWYDGQMFDRILADVPCSASGIVRRHVDIKWLRREEDIVSFTQQQSAILLNLWQILAKGGKLLYVTCSVFEQENQRQIDAFLSQHADAKQLPIRLEANLGQHVQWLNGQLIPSALHDGLFYALLQKFSLFFGILAISCLAWAAVNAITVKSADLIPSDEYLHLNTDFDISFDSSIEEAINKGVALTFLVEFQIVEPREYWFDDEIVTVSKSVKLSYHALTKQYLVGDEVHQKSFESLSEARHQLSMVRDWRVVAKRELEKGATYRAAVLMRLDKTKLPKAIQVDTLGSENWNLASPIYTWPVKELK